MKINLERTYGKETIFITVGMILLNFFQFFLSRFILTGKIFSGLGAGQMESTSSNMVMVLYLLFGLLFGLVMSFLFIMHQKGKAAFAERDKRSREELEKANRQLRSLDELKSRFITVASHQMRTPLNSIRWNLETLIGGETGKLKSDQEMFLRQAHKADCFIIGVMDDLVTAMDVEEGRFRLERAPVVLEEMVKSVIGELSSDAKVKGIKIDFKWQKDNPLEIDGDVARLRQVAWKIIDNAIRYSGENGKISVLVEYDGSGRIVVTDNGIGIPATEQQHLFKKFFRASNAATVHPNGSGLGLYLSRAIVEAHSGKISLNSIEGQGTVVTVSLPAVSL